MTPNLKLLIHPEADQPRWYAIYVNSRAEKKVEADLTCKGIETFLPLKKSLRKWSDRKKWIDMPLIPGYCFVKIVLKINSLEFCNQPVVGLSVLKETCSHPGTTDRFSEANA